MTGSAVTVQVEGTVASIGIDDGKANALTIQVISAINDSLDEGLDGARAIVLQGRPGFLCAGFHLPTMREAGEVRTDLIRSGLRLLVRLFELDRPLVIACTGHALAAGAGLLCVGDVRIGANGDYKIGFSEVAAGVNLGRPIVEIARYRMATTHFDGIIRGDVMAPTVAQSAGLLDAVVADGDVLASAMNVAERLASLDPSTYARAKVAVRGPAAKTIHDALVATYGDAATR